MSGAFVQNDDGSWRPIGEVVSFSVQFEEAAATDLEHPFSTDDLSGFTASGSMTFRLRVAPSFVRRLRYKSGLAPRWQYPGRL